MVQSLIVCMKSQCDREKKNKNNIRFSDNWEDKKRQKAFSRKTMRDIESLVTRWMKGEGSLSKENALLARSKSLG